MHTLSLRVPDALNEALEAEAREAETSKSEIARNHLLEAVVESETEIPEFLETEIKRERMKRRNRLTWQRIHFPSNVADRFRRAFEQGDLGEEINPGAVEEIKEIHSADAEVLFEDDPERREAALEYVGALAEHAAEAADASEFDRLDPEEMFSRYSGVESGKTREEIEDFEALEAEARSRLRRVGSEDPEAVATALSNEFQIPVTVARDAVERASPEPDPSTNGHHNGGGGE